MLGLSFNTKSNVPVFAVFKCQNIIYLLFIYPYNIHIKQNVLHNFSGGTVITLNSTDLTTYLNRAVCVFPYVWPVVFIMIMNRLHCEGRMLKWAHAALKQSLDLFPIQQWKQLLLVMKIIGIVKGLLLFVYINNKKLSLLFCKIRKK